MSLISVMQDIPGQGEVDRDRLPILGEGQSLAKQKVQQKLTQD